MPIFEYQYTNAEGETRLIERLSSWIDAPDTVTVNEGDETYIAKRVTISLTARMKMGWAQRDNVSDVPPENFPVID